MFKSLRILLNAVATIVVIAGLAVPAFAQEVDDGDSNGKGQASWSVQDPPGEWRPITIDADEVSWSSVDVSPDGKFLVFDFLGDLYRLPIDGGDAVSLTDGIAWDFQPTFSPDGYESRLSVIAPGPKTSG